MKKFQVNEPWPKSDSSGVFAHRDITRFPVLAGRAELGAIAEVLRPPLNEDDLRIEIERVPFMSMPELKISKVRVIHKPSGLFAECASFTDKDENENTARYLLSFKLDDWNLQKKNELSRSAPTTPRKMT